MNLLSPRPAQGVPRASGAGHAPDGARTAVREPLPAEPRGTSQGLAAAIAAAYAAVPGAGMVHR